MSDLICPRGYICDFINETLVYPLVTYSCRDLQKDVQEDYGDILAGIYCEEGTLEDGGATIKNCPAGHYCPDPFDDPIKCSAGFYCPTKSSREDLFPCKNCKEGATSFAINVDMLVALVLITVGIILFIYVSTYYIQKKNLKQKKKPKDRISFKSVQKFKHILQMIDERLGESFKIKTNKVGEVIDFDSNHLFDAIDTDNSGEISYAELDKAMALTGNQLSIFIQNMNQLAGTDSSDTVTRECFVRFFFEAIKLASNFDPDESEAQSIFESFENIQQDTVALEPETFYRSTLSTFLSDKQILRLVRKLNDHLHASGDDNVDIEDKISADAKAQSSGRAREIVVSSVGIVNKTKTISKENFVRLYPIVMAEIVEIEKEEKRPPFDIHFENLSLTVKTKEGEKHVVHNLTGRVQSGSMTALMGGSGAGKTSLLNSLCGRAHYGTTLGLIHVNGQVVEINSCVHAIGFVPQDDIVYAELTVRENLLIAGKLRLPRGTTTEYIENLADDVIADLALTRVANSIVGDVTTRGISGGEKKRVNIGLELMCKPAILFLDEPTSGLDSSSAMTVMKNLSNIVRNKGMTVCSVIHQPRKQIFEVFDSLILLGVGGKMVFHGKTSYAKEYFESLGYVMEGGEALADWMIDISSGELSPAKTSKEALNDSVFGNEVEEKIIEVHVENNVEPNEDWARFSGSFSSSNKVGFEVKYDSNPQCNSSNPILSKDFPPEDMSPLLDVDNDRVGDVAVDNRERLYRAWDQYFNNLGEEGKRDYSKPPISNLPKEIKKPSFLGQVWVQFIRCGILFRRNIFVKMQEAALVIAGTIILSIVKGPLELTKNVDPRIPSEYYVLTSVGVDPGRFESSLPFIFRHGIGGARDIIDYGGMIAVVVSVLVLLSSAKVLTSKRTEFFREAASGYDINAYFFAVVSFASLEVSTKMILASLFAFALRSSASGIASYVVHFIMLGWISSAWGFLFPLLFPLESVVLVGAFYALITCFLLSGFPKGAIEYSQIYREGETNALVAGLFTPSRFFTESLAVGELRTLSEQHGFTNYTVLANENDPDSKYVSFGFNQTSLGLLDPHTYEQSRGGWYWAVVPSLLVGLTVRLAAFIALHLKNRKQMLKPPIYKKATTKSARMEKCSLILLLILFITSCALSIYSFTHGYDAYELCEVSEEYLDNIGYAGECHEEYNTKFCRFDRGDCKEQNLIAESKKTVMKKYPNCIQEDENNYLRIGDGRCDIFEDEINNESCGWDDGDCTAGPRYPECVNIYPDLLGDKECNKDGIYNTEKCGWDDGDCFDSRYPNCDIPSYGNVTKLGDGVCEDYRFNVPECEYEGGDCVEFNEKYPDCPTRYPDKIGNGYCDGSIYGGNTEECGWDGGDCLEFNEKYADCTEDFIFLGDGSCTSSRGFGANTEECGFEDGDCLEFNEKYPDCLVKYPSWVGDGYCDGTAYNTEECGWDGGDCLEFKEKYPDCLVEYPSWVGNGNCDGTAYNTEECGWDGGDCLEFKEKYPDCLVEYTSWVGDGYCDGTEYNTEECGWDGGDCLSK